MKKLIKFMTSDGFEDFIAGGGLCIVLSLMLAITGMFTKQHTLIAMAGVLSFAGFLMQRFFYIEKRVRLLLDSHIDLLKEMVKFNTTMSSLARAQKEREERGY